MKVVTNPSFSFGATGVVRLDSNGDRIADGISFDIWNLKTGTYVPDSSIIRYKLGNMVVAPNDIDFTFCDPNQTKLVHGRGNLCHPKIIYNSKNNQRPDPIHPTLMRVNLGIATSLYRIGSSFLEDMSGQQRTLAILMAIDRVNDKDDSLSETLFNATPIIKYEWKNTARSATYSALAGSYFWGQHLNLRALMLLSGHYRLVPTAALQDLLRHKKILQLSPSATSATLSDAKAYPYYYRAVPSDLALWNACEICKICNGLVGNRCNF